MNANISPYERKHDVNRQYRKTQEGAHRDQVDGENR